MSSLEKKLIFDKKYYYWFGKDIQADNIVRVRDIFDLSRELSEKPEEEDILSLTQKGIVVRDVSKNEGQLPKSFNEYNKIKKGDIVLNPMDLLTGWVDISNHDGLISPSYKTLRIKDGKENIKFYCFQLQRYYKDKILFNAGEGVSYDYRWGITDEILMNFPILTKSIEEQNNIVNNLEKSLEKIDKLIENNNKKNKLLTELKNSSYKSYF